jgi:hypothetical protein
MQSASALGYGYRNICFFLPPFRLWEVVKLEWRPELARSVESARVVVKSHHMQPKPLEIRAFVNQPDANSKTRTAGNRSFAAIGAFFGHGEADPHGAKAQLAKVAPESDGHGGHRPPARTAVKERFDLELDITAALKLASAQGSEVTLKLVAVDANGDEVPADQAIIEEVVIEIE